MERIFSAEKGKMNLILLGKACYREISPKPTII
jgi:hypothetical protein